MFLSDAPLRPGRPEAKSVAKLITLFLNFQTFSKKFLFLFFLASASPRPLPDGFESLTCGVFLKSECKVKHFLNYLQIF